MELDLPAPSLLGNALANPCSVHTLQKYMATVSSSNVEFNIFIKLKII
jgi:hypothetical protein